MTTYKSRSTVRPAEWDITSSPTTVYHNYDIVEIEVEEDLGNGREGGIEYEYTTNKMSQQEYNVYVTSRVGKLETQNADLAEAIVKMNYSEALKNINGGNANV